VRPQSAPEEDAVDPGVSAGRWTGSRVGSAIRRWAVVVACVLALVLVASVTGLLPWQVMRVGSASMEPTIPTGAVVLVDRWSDEIDRMDVVVVGAPDGVGPQLVKRAVAVGGDEIALEDGVLVVNGRPVCEPSIDPALIDAEYFGPLLVPSGDLFLLGDNRQTSIDSRVFGTVRADEVRGRVLARMWPSPGGTGVGSGC
jgi:signal peptidase I